MAKLSVNGKAYFVNDEPDTPLLWVLREALQLTGTKFGCGGGHCGCCTVHINGEAMRSCRVRLGDVEGAIITTIEGLSATSEHPVQKAWVELQVPQCGYCHSGQIMQAAAFLTENINPTDDEIDVAMRGNLCRCMTYIRVRKAVKLAAEIKSGGKL
jgi:isoquinoline 1-oxidoreductase alpha subunit